MNPFMIEDEDDDEEITQNSMSDEVEVELYGQNKVRSSACMKGTLAYPFSSRLHTSYKSIHQV